VCVCVAVAVVHPKPLVAATPQNPKNDSKDKPAENNVESTNDPTKTDSYTGSFDGISFERILSHGTDRPLFLDLDTGRFLSPPLHLWSANNTQKISLLHLPFTPKLKGWLRQQGIDAAVQTDGDSIMLYGIELQVGKLPAATEERADLTPRKVAELVVNQPADTWITCRYIFSDDNFGSKLPFITREGGIGLLGIMGLTDLRGPDSIRVHYQIVRPAFAKRNARQAPELAILGDFAGFLVVSVERDSLQLRLPGGRGTITLRENMLEVSSAAHADLTAARIITGHLDIDAINQRVLIFGYEGSAVLRAVGSKVYVEMEDRVAVATRVTLQMPELKIYPSALEWKDK
jgi:hypothetical protein